MQAYSSRLGYAALEVEKVNERVAGLSPELYILTGLTQVCVSRSIRSLN
jgi:hypothetical protein